MKTTILNQWLLATLVFFVSAVVHTACTQQQAKSALNGALTASQIACALEHSLLGDPQIAQVCAIQGDLAPVLRTLIGSHRAAAKRETAASTPMVPDCKKSP
jgi:hypothetical protein